MHVFEHMYRQAAGFGVCSRRQAVPTSKSLQKFALGNPHHAPTPRTPPTSPDARSRKAIRALGAIPVAASGFLLKSAPCFKPVEVGGGLNWVQQEVGFDCSQAPLPTLSFARAIVQVPTPDVCCRGCPSLLCLPPPAASTHL